MIYLCHHVCLWHDRKSVTWQEKCDKAGKVWQSRKSVTWQEKCDITGKVWHGRKSVTWENISGRCDMAGKLWHGRKRWHSKKSVTYQEGVTKQKSVTCSSTVKVRFCDLCDMVWVINPSNNGFSGYTMTHPCDHRDYIIVWQCVTNVTQ